MNGMARAILSIPFIPVRFYVPCLSFVEKLHVEPEKPVWKENRRRKKRSDDSSAARSAVAGIAGAVAKLFDKNEKEVAKLRPMVDRINQLGPGLKAMSDEELKAKSAELRQRFRDEVTARLQRQKDPAGNAYEWQELSTELDWSDDYHRVRRAAEKKCSTNCCPKPLP
jgi:hypothetical protein